MQYGSHLLMIWRSLSVPEKYLLYSRDCKKYEEMNRCYRIYNIVCHTLICYIVSHGRLTLWYRSNFTYSQLFMVLHSLVFWNVPFRNVLSVSKLLCIIYTSTLYSPLYLYVRILYPTLCFIYFEVSSSFFKQNRHLINMCTYLTCVSPDIILMLFVLLYYSWIKMDL